MARRNREHNLLTNIDVTPLVDLTFILLIVFMVTAPAMESRVQLPTMDADEKESKMDSVVISLDDHGNIYIDRDLVSLSQLGNVLKNTPQDNKNFSIRADETSAYGEVISLMKIVREAGIENVDLITLNEK
ncbi:MAG: biopolymer transporter ExbD [Lentisphaeraceae bacterium]|nr:biopolymer transporter ExbD [Lentisphaeraceae bacterium]